MKRGVKKVQLVTSDAHEGLKSALSQVFSGASWQRCRVHFMRNILAHVPKKDKCAVADAVRMIFNQPDRYTAGIQLHRLAQSLQKYYPKAAKLLLEAEEDILAFMAFPREHWSRIQSINLLERIYKEVKRRTNVVGVFPDQDSLFRLAGMGLIEIDDNWRAGRRYFQIESMEVLKDWKKDSEKEKTSFLVDVIADFSLEAQSNLHH